MLGQRVLTAIVLLALLVPALFAPVSWPFHLLTLLLIAAAGWEWGRLNQAGMASSVIMGVALALACVAAVLAGWPQRPPAQAGWLAQPLSGEALEAICRRQERALTGRDWPDEPCCWAWWRCGPPGWQ